MKKVEKAKKEILKMIEEQRARLNPDIIEKTTQALEDRAKNSIPYDKKAARETIELFLRNHKDPQGFSKRLAKKMDD